MTEKKGKRAVIISNIKSGSIEQAIFILKSPVYDACTDRGIVAEAQEIINSYINAVEKVNPARKKKSVNKILFTAGIALTAILILLTLIFKF